MPFARQCSRIAFAGLVASLAGCTDSSAPLSVAALDPSFASNSASSTPTVTSTSPSDAPRGTTLDVQVNGSGYDRGSQVSITLHGVADGRVLVNKTSYVKSSQLVANVTIASDAVADRYDVAVVTSAGKTGIGTEQFEVTLQAEALVGGSRANAVNASGTAVGNGPSTATCSSQILPKLWRPDGSSVTLPLDAYCGANALAINGSQVILGSLSGSASNARGLWVPSGGSYTLQEIGPAPDGSRPITGGALTEANETVGWGQGSARMYWWSAASGWLAMQVPSGATVCQVYNGINNRGVIVGKCTVDGVQNGYYWQDRSAAPVLLPRPAAAGDVTPHDINDAGVIVGYLYGSVTKALRWVPTESGYSVCEILSDLGTGAAAYGVAEDGTIAGSIKKGTNSSRAAIWLPSGAYRLLGGFKNGAGEALDAANMVTGLVVVGREGTQALRWRTVP